MMSTENKKLQGIITNSRKLYESFTSCNAAEERELADYLHREFSPEEVTLLLIRLTAITHTILMFFTMRQNDDNQD